MRRKRKASEGADHLGRLITTGEAAGHCQVSVPALRRWIREGRLHAFRTPGKHARIEVREFQRFLEEYRLPPYPRTEPSPTPRVPVVEGGVHGRRSTVRVLATAAPRP